MTQRPWGEAEEVVVKGCQAQPPAAGEGLRRLPEGRRDRHAALPPVGEQTWFYTKSVVICYSRNRN